MSSSDIRNLLNLLESIMLMELTDKVKNQQFERLKEKNPNFDPDEIKKYIDAWGAFVQGFPEDKRNITVLSLEEIVRLVRDASFKSSLKGRDTPFHKKPEINRDMDVVYNKNGLEILKGDLKEKCIRYGKNSKWCISRNDAQNMFYTYRMRLDEPAFYFVFDTDRPETDPLHRFVIHIDKNGNYKLTDFDNLGDKDVTWDEIEQMQPKLRGLKKLFVPVPLSSEERTDYEKYKDMATDKAYGNFSLEEKYKYFKFGHSLTDRQQELTPDELIGVYAKLMPTEINNKTWNRLKSGDKRKIISDVIDENNNIDATKFALRIMKTPWHLTELPNEVIEKAHNKITKDKFLAPSYAVSIFKTNYEISDIPDIIWKSVRNSSDSSYAFAMSLYSDPDTFRDISYIPEIIIQGIANDSENSYKFAIKVLETNNNDLSIVPEIIIQGIAKNSYFSRRYAEEITEIIVYELDNQMDISYIPEIIIQGIANDSENSYMFVSSILSYFNYDLSAIPKIILNSINQDSYYRDILKKFISKYKNETIDLSRLKILSGIK